VGTSEGLKHNPDTFVSFESGDNHTVPSRKSGGSESIDPGEEGRRDCEKANDFAPKVPGR